VIRPFSFLLLAVPLLAQSTFEVEEATIAQVHDARKAGRLTCRTLVDQYLKRIDAYDKNGPAINSIVMVNPNVTKEADELDRRFAQSGCNRTTSLRPDDRQG
jgi:Asp-tRNA(Asn)/Glu-tRNA(Gln) amidotransferase A subunit family amidase